MIDARIDHYLMILDTVQQTRADLESRIEELSRHNVELEERKARLEGLKATSGEMQRRLERWRIELDAPPRVQVVQNAIASPLTWWGEEDEDEETSDLLDYSAY